MYISLNYKHLKSYSTKKLIGNTKNRENVLSFEMLKVVLVHCNLVDNQYQQNSEVLYTVTSNKSYAYQLNVKAITLVNKDFGVMQLVTVSYGFCGAEFKNHIHFC